MLNLSIEGNLDNSSGVISGFFSKDISASCVNFSWRSQSVISFFSDVKTLKNPSSPIIKISPYDNVMTQANKIVTNSTKMIQNVVTVKKGNMINPKAKVEEVNNFLKLGLGRNRQYPYKYTK